MKSRFLACPLVAILVSTLFGGVIYADTLTGFSDITMNGSTLVSLRYEGTEYVAAGGDLMLGTTTRWYIPAATGVATLWVDGDPAPAATNANSSNPKVGDIGANADDWVFGVSGAADGMSSIDGIDYQETVFPVLTDTIFIFERGGNDTGTYQAILADGSLGAPVPFVAANVYSDTGVDVGGQNAFGVVFTTDVRVKGVRISAPGHDALVVCAIPKPLDPKQTHDPRPENEATDVLRDVVLSWTPGEDFAPMNGHIVHFGTSLDDVVNGIGGVAQSATTFDPGRLEFGVTYYWRVDEVSAAPGGAVFEGEVWSFTVEPAAYPIQNIIATASSAQAGMGPENTVNGSGLTQNDEHSTEGTQMWLSTGTLPNWIEYEFDAVYKLHEMWVWNSNQLVEPFVGFGAKDVRIEYSPDGATWTEMAGVPQFAQASGSSTYTHNTTIPLDGVLAQYVRLNIDTLWGAVTQSGLSEVRFFSIPVQAREPAPPDAATDVDIDAMLSWRPGREAGSHTVYLGKDKNAVTDGTAPTSSVADSTFSPAALDYATTYYWRVDEVNDAAAPSVYEGVVWSFTTQAYEVVDDFESYTDDEGNRIYEAWLDGYGTTTNGSQVGYAQAPFAEMAIVHGGRQSMPLSYNNVGGIAASEAERTLDAAQDWTRAGLATLAVHFRGDPNNTTGRLYLKINGVKILYDGDMAAMQSVSWTEWHVDLASVGTNLKKVTKLVIGIDNGGQGILYIDDIRLLPAAPVSSTTVAVDPAESIEATGNDGTILSINGVAVADLILDTTTTDFEMYADHPAAHADDFDLGTYASLDDSKAITVMFPVPVHTIFIVERGANDSGFLQPLDAAGQPVGEPQPFVAANWSKLAITINGQTAGGLMITATPPISGITLLPPAGGVTGIDPASISAIPAQ